MTVPENHASMPSVSIISTKENSFKNKEFATENRRALASPHRPSQGPTSTCTPRADFSPASGWPSEAALKLQTLGGPWALPTFSKI